LLRRFEIADVNDAAPADSASYALGADGVSNWTPFIQTHRAPP